MIKINVPPVLSGNAEKQTQQLYSYLYQLSQLLNAANEQISTQTDDQIAKALKSTASGAGVSEAKLSQTASSLRALIASTADTVEGNIDRVESRLSSNITSISGQYGTLSQTVTKVTEDTASLTTNVYNYSQEIKAVDAEFSTYKEHVEGFIDYGCIYADGAENPPTFGIVIGESLSSTTVIIDGKEYQQFSTNLPCAFYTSNKVSFRLGGEEVAYFSNQSLHCGNIECGERVTMNGKWQIGTSNHFTVKWVGKEENG